MCAFWIPGKPSNPATAKRRRSGFTLVEVMVVMAIIAVLAAVVYQAVTGSGEKSRMVTYAADVKSVKGSADRFNAEGGAWPTGDGAAAPGALSAGTMGDPIIVDSDTAANIQMVPIAWDKACCSQTFVPDYSRDRPRHADETIAFAGEESKQVNGVYYKNEKTTATSVNRWLLDSAGAVHCLVTKPEY